MSNQKLREALEDAIAAVRGIGDPMIWGSKLSEWEALLSYTQSTPSDEGTLTPAGEEIVRLKNEITAAKRDLAEHKEALAAHVEVTNLAWKERDRLRGEYERVVKENVQHVLALRKLGVLRGFTTHVARDYGGEPMLQLMAPDGIWLAEADLDSDQAEWFKRIAAAPQPPTAGVGSGWISVDERLPERSGQYLLFIKGHAYGKIGSFYAEVNPRFTWRKDLVTHWMPLPKPPVAASLPVCKE